MNYSIDTLIYLLKIKEILGKKLFKHKNTPQIVRKSDCLRGENSKISNLRSCYRYVTAADNSYCAKDKNQNAEDDSVPAEACE